jgi:hypothetical protein
VAGVEGGWACGVMMRWWAGRGRVVLRLCVVGVCGVVPAVAGDVLLVWLGDQAAAGRCW